MRNLLIVCGAAARSRLPSHVCCLSLSSAIHSLICDRLVLRKNSYTNISIIVRQQPVFVNVGERLNQASGKGWQFLLARIMGHAGERAARGVL